MIFQSVNFGIFILVVFLLYWLVGRNNVKWQNLLLLLASYFFYGFASLKIVPILLLATGVFYFLGHAIEHAYDETDEQKAEKIGGRWTTLGVVLGVGFLLYFKYFNFFISSFVDLLSWMGLHSNWHTMKIIMPLGISFFTFKLIAYVLDVNHGKIHAEKDFVQFAAYIAFFPCILSGPIDRPQFMKQLKKARVFGYDMAADGCRQFLWGLFKKVVVADNCAMYVDAAWSNIGGSSASTLLLAAVLYSMELYADFSGYSDMAIGVGKWLGLKVTDNFKCPYFSRNMREFWRRWHISLNSWLVDYIYIPLGGSKNGQRKMLLNIMTIFLISGLWHGASWTFVCWGAYHGALLVLAIIMGVNTKYDGVVANQQFFPSWIEIGQMLMVFLLSTLGWMMFRADSFSAFGEYVQSLCNASVCTMPVVLSGLKRTLLFTMVMLVVEWINREKAHPFALENVPLWVRIPIYYALIICVLEFAGDAQSFIYFQF